MKAHTFVRRRAKKVDKRQGLQPPYVFITRPDQIGFFLLVQTVTSFLNLPLQAEFPLTSTIKCASMARHSQFSINRNPISKGIKEKKRIEKKENYLSYLPG